MPKKHLVFCSNILDLSNIKTPSYESITVLINLNHFIKGKNIHPIDYEIFQRH